MMRNSGSPAARRGRADPGVLAAHDARRRGRRSRCATGRHSISRCCASRGGALGLGHAQAVAGGRRAGPRRRAPPTPAARARLGGVAARASGRGRARAPAAPRPGRPRPGRSGSAPARSPPRRGRAPRRSGRAASRGCRATAGPAPALASRRSPSSTSTSAMRQPSTSGATRISSRGTSVPVTIARSTSSRSAGADDRDGRRGRVCGCGGLGASAAEAGASAKGGAERQARRAFHVSGLPFGRRGARAAFGRSIRPAKAASMTAITVPISRLGREVRQDRAAHEKPVGERRDRGSRASADRRPAATRPFSCACRKSASIRP